MSNNALDCREYGMNISVHKIIEMKSDEKREWKIRLNKKGRE